MRAIVSDFSMSDRFCESIRVALTTIRMFATQELYHSEYYVNEE